MALIKSFGFFSLHDDINLVTYLLNRDLEFPEKYRGEISQTLSKLKLNMDELRKVDNSCPPHPDKNTFQKVESAIEDVNPEEVKPESPPIDVKD